MTTTTRQPTQAGAALGLPKILADHRKWLAGEGGQRANLTGAGLSGADLRGVNLRRANLTGADLSGADLSGADLSAAYLRGVNLRRVNLRRADLSGADLSGADLSAAYLTGAYLTGAYLTGADLSGADLYRADLRGADLYGAAGTASTSGLGSERRTAYGVAWPDGVMMVQAGCWWGTEADMRARIAPGGDHGWPDADAPRYRAGYTAALDSWRAVLGLPAWTGTDQ